MSRTALCAMAATWIIGGCAAGPGVPPSLAPRAAEAIYPRVPVQSAVASAAADTGLRDRLGVLVGRALAGDSAFLGAIDDAERLAAAAAGPQSESWVVAQQALSAAVAARRETTQALGDIDAIAASALAARGGLGPADLAAVQEASLQVAEIDRRQAARVDAVQRRLGGA